ncbi:MAG: primosomal protein N' [Lachnospiraceae bacterium]|nr:primosomal protein N' [Lachnospiraceae bacterium]
MLTKYADVIIDISHEKVDRPFQYRIPEDMLEGLEVGMCVTVPFGKGNTLRRGYVTDITEKCSFDPQRIKEVHSLARDGVGVEDCQIRLARWIRLAYGGTMIQALKTVLPAKHTVKKAERRKLCLAVTREEGISLLGECRRKKQTARARLLQELLREGELPYELATGKLMVSPAVIRGLEGLGAVRVEVLQSFRNPVKQQRREEAAKALSGEQQAAVKRVMEDYDGGDPGTYLLQGITGSGKTEVYIRLAQEMVERGRQVIVLIPEIALTYQTLMRFYRCFGDRVSVLNSTLSAGEKYDQCERAKCGEIDVIIGPRSALFVPFPKVGLILMDEEHEASYKSESTPKYHARETAVYLASLHGASVVLGSATPSMEAAYRAREGQYRPLFLTRRLTGGSLPRVYTVDLREELKQGNRSIFSRKLQELLEDRLKKGQQGMLFINRRGFAGFVSCRACGHVMKCPHCDVSLSQHRGGRLVCHYCGYETPDVTACPECGSGYISGFRAGTQQIEERLKAMFPNMRVLRMDADTTRTKDSHGQILAAFAAGEADVLVGTQMIVKGHDFPNVTLVGVLAADLSLSVGDYRAGERTFQLLTQAAGRAGRGSEPGEVVIQTYQPEHYAVTHAAAQDYDGFYREEILFRELMGYPPVAHMLAVQIYAAWEEEGSRLALGLAELAGTYVDQSQPLARRMMIVGPAPAGVGKVNDIFRFVFYVKDHSYRRLIQVKDGLEKRMGEWMQTRRSRQAVSLQFDFDPMNTL